MCFNSRARKGRDTLTFAHTGTIPVSIHAPVKGAIPALDALYKLRYVSIHAPVKGAISIEFRTLRGRLVSIHAPVKGAISPRDILHRRNISFNSRARKGRD